MRRIAVYIVSLRLAGLRGPYGHASGSHEVLELLRGFSPRRRFSACHRSRLEQVKPLAIQLGQRQTLSHGVFPVPLGSLGDCTQRTRLAAKVLMRSASELVMLDTPAFSESSAAPHLPHVA